VARNNNAKATARADAEKTKAQQAEDLLWRTCLCGMSRKLQPGEDGVLRWADHNRYTPGTQSDGLPGVMTWCPGSQTEPRQDAPATVFESGDE